MINNNKIQNTEKIVKKRNGLPLKCITTNSAGGLNSAGRITVLSVPAQGLGNGQRTGDEINIEDIEITFLSYYGDDVNVIRYIVLQLEGFTPALALGTFLDTGASGAVDPTSLYIPFYEGRFFKILYDRVIAVVQNGSNAAVPDRVVLKPKIKIMPFVPASTQVTNAQIVVLALSDSAILPNPSFDFTARVYYRDI